MKIKFGCGFNMSSVCVVGVLFLFLFLSQILASEQICTPQKCDPGYFRKDRCGPNNTYNLCETCKKGYYTDIQNTNPRCLDCGRCGRNMLMIDCTTTSNVKCSCKVGYHMRYNDCYISKTTFKENLPAPPPTTPPSALTSNKNNRTTERQNITTPKTDNSSTDVSKIVWVILVLLLLPVMYCVPVLFIRKLYKYLHLCPRWRDKEDVETPVQSKREPGCLQSPTTLAFTISEETPMMDVMSPVPPEPPAHTSPLLPTAETRGNSNTSTIVPDSELSEAWPAKVLYAVIKEVPLRRWKEFLRLLSVADQQLERVELDAGLSLIERQYQMIRLWSQKTSVNIDEIYSALHYMELSGCAQMLKESLEKLQWKLPGVTV